jgi:dihydroorotate dehydrogenase
VVNVSSPNTPGLRALQEKDALKNIFNVLQKSNQSKKNPKKILLKIAPDLSIEQVNDIIDLSVDINLDGLIVSNTTIDRIDLVTDKISVENIGLGGLSGLPLQTKSTELIKYINIKTDGKLCIIGSGGIFNGKDAKEKIDAGAALIQVWTGFVYEGPSISKRISNFLKH